MINCIPIPNTVQPLLNLRAKPTNNQAYVGPPKGYLSKGIQTQMCLFTKTLNHMKKIIRKPKLVEYVNVEKFRLSGSESLDGYII